MCKPSHVLLFTTMLVFFGCAAADDIRDRVEDEVADRIDRGVDDGVEGAADATEGAIRGGIRCVATDEECIERAEESDEDVVLTDDDGEVITDDAGQPIDDPDEAISQSDVSDQSSVRPGEGAWSNYDFVPGNRLLFYEDFSDDQVGRFPQRVEFQAGAIQVVEWEGDNMLRAAERGAFDVQLDEVMPERFTVELDFHSAHRNNRVDIYMVDGEGDSVGAHFIRLHPRFRMGIEGFSGDDPISVMNPDISYGDRFVPIRVAADGDYMMVYVEEQRVANIPNADFGRSDALRFDIRRTRGDAPILLGSLRIAASDQSLYEELAEDGRVITRGIYFDTASASIRPESTGSLEEIGEMLTEHGDLSLRIEGHTDNVGDAGMNQELSQQRAEAVRSYLIDHYNVDGSRLDAVGVGEDEPVASNDTAEGRQENRRVELVRD